MMLINAINAINLCNLEIDFKSWPSQEIHFKFCPSQETDFKSCPSQELQTGHGSPSTRGAPQGLPADYDYDLWGQEIEFLKHFPLLT